MAKKNPKIKKDMKETTEMRIRRAQNGPIVAETNNNTLLSSEKMQTLLSLLVQELAPLLERRIDDNPDGVKLTIEVEQWR